MSKFIAIHTFPWSEEHVVAMIKEATKWVPTGFQWKQTYCDFDNHKFFCEWDAPNRQAIEHFFQAMKVPYDRVHPVKILDSVNTDINN